jgi:NAD+ kinase
LTLPTPSIFATAAPVKLQRLVVHGNPLKPGVTAVLHDLAQWTRAQGIALWIEQSLEPTATGIDRDAVRFFDAPIERAIALPEKAGALILCLGGDGTLLHAVHRLWPLNGTPVMAVNLGSLSFNATVEAGKVTSAIELWQAGQAQIHERLVLDVRIYAGGTLKHSGLAVNDVVLAKRSEARMIHLHLWQDGEQVLEYAGDGIIIATPTGSTAYNLSAGGPILYPSLCAVVATAICPHTLAVRPVILPAQPPLSLEFVPHHGRENSMVYIDGQETKPLDAGDRLEICAAAKPLRLVHLPGTQYFERLREKLLWGGRLYPPGSTPQ